MRILLTGGGTLGSVSPLLAIIPQLKEEGHEVHFVGTIKGPEQAVVEQMDIPFYSIIAPKFRRYFTWKHLLMPFEFFLGFTMSLVLLFKWRQNVIVSAGGFVAVPLTWAGWLLRIPTVIHQQDLQPGLANRLMQPFAKKITVSFQKSLNDFSSDKDKVSWIGNPVRDLTPQTDAIKLSAEFPTVLIFGGGTGAQAINDLVTKQICEFANVIHLTGKDRASSQVISHPRYYGFDFLNQEMAEALHKADLIVARAGIGTISELAALSKPAIIIPMPETHQENNTAFLEEQNAAVVLDQRQLTPDSFATQIKQLLQDDARQQELSKNISKLTKPDAVEQFTYAIKKAGKTSK